MATDDLKSDVKEEQGVTWTSRQRVRSNNERRSQDRREFSGRVITVPDMRSGSDRRNGNERRKVRLVITGRAIDV